MMFASRITSIGEKDKVLEVGPGGNPFHRSDVLLEKKFNKHEQFEQRGGTPELKTNKTIVYYSGLSFPFKSDEFDYVICSHVIEHVEEEEIPFFLSELQRVAKRGYIEFPTAYYDYLYNFDVHKTFVYYDGDKINFSSKKNFNLDSFKPIQNFFHTTLELGEESILESYRTLFFQGFEWNEEIKSKKVSSLKYLTFPLDSINNNSLSIKRSLKNIKNEMKNIISIIRS